MSESSGRNECVWGGAVSARCVRKFQDFISFAIKWKLARAQVFDLFKVFIRAGANAVKRADMAKTCGEK
ncbi:MAG: hypothetical protein B6D41_02910 [Chloroflexi bacterium UTCFX4]|jgi:hypothetical protein|nr:MAG: hypothetical protein B6D41_02910 [Chloroflexi bacterium UTCFX4]